MKPVGTKPTSTICPTCGRTITQKARGPLRYRHDECAEYDLRFSQMMAAAAQMKCGSRIDLMRIRGDLMALMNKRFHASLASELPNERPSIAAPTDAEYPQGLETPYADSQAPENEA